MQRRAFLKTIAAGINAIIGASLAVVAGAFLYDPLRRARGERGYLRVARLASVPRNEPLRVTVTADRRDAYTHHSAAPLGQIWLVPAPASNQEQPLRCFQATCPHLGCTIEYAPARGAFFCPCHASEFDISGRQRFGPSPRDMDELPCRVVQAEDAQEKWVEVEYAEFETGISEKRPS